MGKFLFETTGESYRLPSVFDGINYYGGGQRKRGSDKTSKNVEEDSIIEKLEKL